MLLIVTKYHEKELILIYPRCLDSLRLEIFGWLINAEYLIAIVADHPVDLFVGRIAL